MTRLRSVVGESSRMLEWYENLQCMRVCIYEDDVILRYDSISLRTRSTIRKVRGHKNS